LSLLGKYRKEEERKSDGEDGTKSSVATGSEMDTSEGRSIETVVSVPNKERKSPIVSFSIATDLRSCLQAVRNEKAINLSMWVERKLRQAVAEEFPDIANKHLDS
jgi:hypothetical protein